MSTLFKSKLKRHELCTFWGGDKRGRMLQITPLEYTLRDTAFEQLCQEEGFIQLTRKEAIRLAAALTRFAAGEDA